MPQKQRQLILPYDQEQTLSDQQLQACRELLSQLLLEIVHAEQKRKEKNDERKTQTQSS